jgi:hypothetical protein
MTKDCTSCEHYQNVDDPPFVMKCLKSDMEYCDTLPCLAYEKSGKIPTSEGHLQMQCANCGHEIKIDGAKRNT